MPSLPLQKSSIDTDVDLGAREPGVLRRDMGLVFDRESFRQSGPVEFPQSQAPGTRKSTEPET